MIKKFLLGTLKRKITVPNTIASADTVSEDVIGTCSVIIEQKQDVLLVNNGVATDELYYLTITFVGDVKAGDFLEADGKRFQIRSITEHDGFLYKGLAVVSKT